MNHKKKSQYYFIVATIFSLGLVSVFSQGSFAGASCKRSDINQAKSFAASTQDLFSQGLLTASEVARSELTVLEVRLCASDITLQSFCPAAQKIIDEQLKSRMSFSAQVSAFETLVQIRTRCASI